MNSAFVETQGSQVVLDKNKAGAWHHRIGKLSRDHRVPNAVKTMEPDQQADEIFAFRRLAQKVEAAFQSLVRFSRGVTQLVP